MEAKQLLRTAIVTFGSSSSSNAGRGRISSRASVAAEEEVLDHHLIPLSTPFQVLRAISDAGLAGAWPRSRLDGIACR